MEGYEIGRFLSADFVNEGKWYDFSEGVRIKIKKITPKENDALLKQATTDFVAGEPQIDRELFGELRKQAAIVDWEGFTSNEEPVPRTPENIIYLLNNCVEFADFVNGILFLDKGDQETKN